MVESGEITLIMKKNNLEFIRTYNELDALIGEKFNRENDDSSIYFLINKYRRSKVEKERIYSNKLDSARKIRNLMVHESGIIDELFDVSDEVVLFLKELIIYLRNPLRAKDVMTPLKSITYGKEEDLVADLIKKGVDEGISNLPILNDKNEVIGILNSDVLLLLFLNNVHLDRKTKVKEIKEYISLQSQINLRFMFVTTDYEIDVLNDYFAYSKEQYKKRLPIIFVSVNGKADSSLLGIISPIDLIIKND